MYEDVFKIFAGFCVNWDRKLSGGHVMAGSANQAEMHGHIGVACTWLACHPRFVRLPGDKSLHPPTSVLLLFLYVLKFFPARESF